MLTTARRLMLRRQGEQFTLQEVSVLGKVSIGSIYFRFRNKDDLVRAVIRQDLADMAASEVQALARAVATSGSLEEFIPAYVRSFGRILHAHALMVGLAMRRAAGDPIVSDEGEAQELLAARRFAEGLAHYRHQVRGNLDARSRVAFQLLFATLARDLSLGSRSRVVSRARWRHLLDELSRVLLAYLKSA